MTALEEPRTTTTHPLEPLTADEVAAASSLLIRARELTDSARFVFVHLHEP
jgi:primary-amine oxidase